MKILSYIVIMLQRIRTVDFLQFIRFGLVGTIATLCHMGTLIILVEIFRYQPIPASTIGFILAVIVSYVLNCRFTFMAKGNHVMYFSKYSIVCMTGLAINTTIMCVTVNVLNWWYIIGQFSTLMIVPVANFTLNKFWTFSKKDEQDIKI